MSVVHVPRRTKPNVLNMKLVHINSHDVYVNTPLGVEDDCWDEKVQVDKI